MNEFEKLQASLKEIASATQATLEKSTETQKDLAESKATIKELQSKIKSQDELHEQHVKELREEIKARPAAPAEAKGKDPKFTLTECAMYAKNGPKYFEENFGQSDRYQALVKAMGAAADFRKSVRAAIAASGSIHGKTMNLWSDPQGGLAVPFEMLEGEFIEKLRAESVAMASGARMITGLTGAPVGINRQSTASTAAWYGLGQKITLSDFKLDQIVALPHRLAAAIQLENNANQLSSPELAQLGSDDMSLQLALALDKAILKGAGTQYEPQGILTDPDITALTTGDLQAASGAGYNKLIAFKKKLMVGNAYRGSLGWVTSPEVYAEITKMKDGSFLPLFPMDPGTSRSGALFGDRALGFPIRTTTQLSGVSGSAEMIFANWAEVLILSWGGLMISTSTEAEDSFLKGQFVVKAELIADVKKRHVESFATAVDIVVT